MYLTTMLLTCCLLGQDAGKPFSPFVVKPDVPARMPEAARAEVEAAIPIPTGPARAPASHAPATAAQHVEEIEGVPTRLSPLESVPLESVPSESVPSESTPSDSTDGRKTPPERIDEALTLPPDSHLLGRRMGVGAALATVASRPQQLEVMRAYWRLADAAGQYRFALKHDAWLKQLSVPEGDPVALKVALAASAAGCDEAQASAVAAQHELAALLRLPADSPLPLPADRPHVGPYRTRFDELFSQRTAPARARLMQQTLPIRCRAIDHRAAAVAMAEDALQAAMAEYRAGRTEMSDVLTCLSRYTMQQQAMLASVCRYNVDIADYALAVAGPTVAGRALVAMLIRPTADSMQPLVPQRDSRIQRAGVNQPIGTPTPAPMLERSPAVAPPQSTDPSPWIPSRPSDAEGAKPVDPGEPVEQAPGEPTRLRQFDFPEPSRMPLPFGASTDRTVPERPMIPVGPEPHVPTTLKQPVAERLPTKGIAD